MRGYKRRKITPNNELHRLLKMGGVDGDAVIEEVRRNPQSAARKYKFRGDYYYPLHQTVRLRANIDVVEAIYNCYPQAIQEKCKGETPLHNAIVDKASIEVVSFLLNKWPDAVRQKHFMGDIPLHSSCRFGARIEVISKLFQSWPDAAKVKNDHGRLPLHTALRHFRPGMETVIFSLLDHYPDVLKETINRGNTPLHIVVRENAPLEVLLTILQGYPEATRERNDYDKTPLNLTTRRANQNGKRALSYVSQLCGSAMDVEKSKEMMNFFTQINWWKGVALILDRYPPLSQNLDNLDVDMNLFPQLLSMIGRCCKLKTMWHVVSNEMDIMEGVF